MRAVQRHRQAQGAVCGLADVSLVRREWTEGAAVTYWDELAALANDDAPKVAPAPEHGSRRQYQRGCRCADCRAANTEYTRARGGHHAKATA